MAFWFVAFFTTLSISIIHASYLHTFSVLPATLPERSAFTAVCLAVDKGRSSIYAFYGNTKAEYSLKTLAWRISDIALRRYYYCYGDQTVYSFDDVSVYLWEYQDFQLIMTDARTTEVRTIRKSPVQQKLEHPTLCRNNEGTYLSEYVFILGGTAADPRGKLFQAYNIETDVYLKLASMEENIAGYATCIIDPASEFLYVFGGLNHRNEPSDAIQRYPLTDLRRISTNKWETLAMRLPYTLYRSASLAVNGWVYIMGGWGPSKNASDPFADDARHLEETWSFYVRDNEDLLNTDGVIPHSNRLGPLQIGREQHGAVLCENEIYVIGGQVYDSDDQRTMEKSSPPFPPLCGYGACAGRLCRQQGQDSFCVADNRAVTLFPESNCTLNDCTLSVCNQCGRHSKCVRLCKMHIKENGLENQVNCENRCSEVNGYKCFMGC